MAMFCIIYYTINYEGQAVKYLSILHINVCYCKCVQSTAQSDDQFLITNNGRKE